MPLDKILHMNQCAVACMCAYVQWLQGKYVCLLSWWRKIPAFQRSFRTHPLWWTLASPIGSFAVSLFRSVSLCLHSAPDLAFYYWLLSWVVGKEALTFLNMEICFRALGCCRYQGSEGISWPSQIHLQPVKPFPSSRSVICWAGVAEWLR